MKKLLVISTLVGSLMFTMPVMAASPSAQTALPTPAAAPARTTTTAPATTVAQAVAAQSLTAEQQAAVTQEANQLVSQGLATTPAAAVAVASTLTKIGAAPAITSASKVREATAVLNTYSAEQRAFIANEAAKRNLSPEEVIANFVKADAQLRNSVAVAWDANLCTSSVNGRSGNVMIALRKPEAAVTASALAEAANISATARVLNAVTLDAGTTFSTLETALNVEGITERDTVDNFVIRQFVNGKWINVQITGIRKGALSFKLVNQGPIMIVRK